MKLTESNPDATKEWNPYALVFAAFDYREPYRLTVTAQIVMT